MKLLICAAFFIVLRLQFRTGLDGPRIRCHNGLCDNVLFTISGWGNDPNLRVNTESKNQENYGRLWYLRFVTEDDDDESMVVNYNSQTFWSVERQGSALKLVLSSTSCSNQPKFRFANVFLDTYHVMYKDTASKELYLLSPIINKPAKKLDPNYVRKNFTDESYFFIFNSSNKLHIMTRIRIHNASFFNPIAELVFNNTIFTPICFNVSTSPATAFNYAVIDYARTTHPTTAPSFAGLWTILPSCNFTTIPRSNHKDFEDHFNTHQECSPMSKTLQMAAKIIHSLGESFIMTATSLTFFLLLIVGECSYERYIHICQEINLFVIHFTVLASAQRTEWQLTCHVVALFLQYLYICLFCLLFLEAMQAYSIKTNMISSRSWIGYFWTHVFFLVIPLIPTLFTACFSWRKLPSIYSCWINFEEKTVMATMAPIFLVAMFTISILEKVHEKEYINLHLTSCSQRKTADVNLCMLWFMIPMHSISWLLTSFAIFYQRFSMFPTVFFINVLLGIMIITSHTLASTKIVLKTAIMLKGLIIEL